MTKEEFLQKINDANDAYKWALHHINEIIKSLDDKKYRQYIDIISPDKIHINGDEFYLTEEFHCRGEMETDYSRNFPLDLLFYTTEEAVAYIKKEVDREEAEAREKLLKEKKKKEDEERELYKQLKEKYENE